MNIKEMGQVVCVIEDLSREEVIENCGSLESFCK